MSSIFRKSPTARSPARALRLTLGLLAGLLLAACGDPTVPEGPPAAPSDVSAVAGPGYVTVSWTDNSDDETGFEVYRLTTAPAGVVGVGPATSPSPQQDAEPLATLPANSTSYVDLEVELETAYEYQVVAVGTAGSTEAAEMTTPVSVQPGVDLMVGTVDRLSEDVTGTVYVAYLVFDDAVLLDPEVEMTATFAGPPGWNDDAVLVGDLPLMGAARQNGFARVQLYSIDAVAGAYTLTVEVDGVTYEATAELDDPTYRHGRPADVTVSVSPDETEVTTTWTPVPGALTTYARIHTNEFGEMLYNVPAFDSATFSGLALPEGIYIIEIMSMNADLVNYPVKTEPFGLSSNYAVFGIGDPQSALCDSPSQVIEIPDAALLEAVRSSLEKPTGDITCVEMVTLEWLSAENAGVTSLEGLEYADNLKWVNFGNNNDITSIEPLGGLPNLLEVTLWGSPIADASPLAGMTTLEHIDLGGTELTDLSFLEGLSNLESLYLWGLYGIDLTPLHDLTQLRWMSLAGDGLTDTNAGFLEDLTSLEALYIENNELTSLAPLVANAGIGDGDEVWVDFNYLDLDDPDVMEDVQTLLDRGVDLHYEEQNEQP